MSETKPITVEQAIQLLADEAEKRGATANDDAGIVRQLVLENGLGFNAWLCVCCELADRSAKREGFRNQSDRALSSPGFQAALAAYRAKGGTQ